ncbi:hypothetical protein EMIT0111MI5_110151 [Burkholderia sp. IT-111MI5]
MDGTHTGHAICVAWPPFASSANARHYTSKIECYVQTAFPQRHALPEQSLPTARFADLPLTTASEFAGCPGRDGVGYTQCRRLRVVQASHLAALCTARPPFTWEIQDIEDGERIATMRVARIGSRYGAVRGREKELADPQQHGSGDVCREDNTGERAVESAAGFGHRAERSCRRSSIGQVQLSDVRALLLHEWTELVAGVPPERLRGARSTDALDNDRRPHSTACRSEPILR